MISNLHCILHSKYSRNNSLIPDTYWGRFWCVNCLIILVNLKIHDDKSYRIIVLRFQQITRLVDGWEQNYHLRLLDIFLYLKKIQRTNRGTPECCPVKRRLSKVVLMVDLCLDIFTLLRHCLTQQADNRYRIRHAVIGVPVGICTVNTAYCISGIKCFYEHLHA